VSHTADVLIRPERTGDETAIRAVQASAFRRPGSEDEPAEAPLVDALRASPSWLAKLSLVAVDGDDVVGHVVCSRGWVGEAEHPALGLGPIGVLPDRQLAGIGHALVHAVLGAADALDEGLVALLGDPRYYGRFGFRTSTDLAVEPPDPAWGAHFQARRLAAWHPALVGPFRYAAPFDGL
jgi:putative acetyltransferase